VVLPALFPGTQNDTLDDWLGHFALTPIGRHDALADAYTGAQLLMIALAAAQRVGVRTTGELVELEAAQRWLGRRR
jgi:DNA polymerase III epsilon subunit-like protein